MGEQVYTAILLMLFFSMKKSLTKVLVPDD